MPDGKASRDLPEAPPIASDPFVAMEIERWLNDRGYQIAYSMGTLRAENGDPILVKPITEMARPRE